MSVKKPYEKMISQVSFAVDEEDGSEFHGDNDSNEEKTNLDPEHIPLRRERANSVFSLHDYIALRRERADTLDLKGECFVSHSHVPITVAEQETSMSYFERCEQAREPKLSFQRSHSYASDTHGKHRKSLAPSCNTDESNTATYELEPLVSFNNAKVREVILEEFDKVRHLPDVDQSIICMELSNDIKKRIKLCGFSRYKYIVAVSMGDDTRNGLKIASGFFWDDKRDNYVTETLQMRGSFIVAVVYAIYTI